MPLRGPLRYSQRSGHLQTLRLEMSTPLNRLRRFPLQGTTPAARQSRFRGAPGRGCACLAPIARSLRSPRGGSGCLISHASLLSRARHAVPLRLIPHASLLITGNHKGCPYGLTPTTSFLIPHSSLLRPHPSPQAGWWLTEQIPDLLQGTWVFHGGQVAGVAAFADGLDGAA